MIVAVRGKIISKHSYGVVIDVNGTFWQLALTKRDCDEVKLRATQIFYITKSNTGTTYGFVTEHSRDEFRKLVASMPNIAADTLYSMIVLKGEVTKEELSALTPRTLGEGYTAKLQHVERGLDSLGYKKTEREKALAWLLEKKLNELTIQELITKVLKEFGKVE